MTVTPCFTARPERGRIWSSHPGGISIASPVGIRAIVPGSIVTGDWPATSTLGDREPTTSRPRARGRRSAPHDGVLRARHVVPDDRGIRDVAPAHHGGRGRFHVGREGLAGPRGAGPASAGVRALAPV